MIELKTITTAELVSRIAECSSAVGRFDFMDTPTITTIFSDCNAVADKEKNTFTINSKMGEFSAPLDSIIEIIPILTDDDFKVGLVPEPNLYSVALDDGRIHYILTLELVY